MHWHTQARNITNNLKVEVDFTLPTRSATNDMEWKCHVDDSVKGRNNTILRQYI